MGNFEIISAKELALPTKDYVLENNTISSKYNNFKINLGELIPITVDNKIVNYQANLFKTTDSRISIFEYPKNKSNIFILPLLCKSYESVGFPKYLINCYCGINGVYDNNLYLLYRYVPNRIMREIEESLLGHNNFLYSESKKDKLLFIFKTTSEMKQIVKHFINGKYSLFNETYKRNLVKFHHNNHRINSILGKDPEYKRRMEKDLNSSIPDENDLLDIPNSKEETLIW